jgi:hypothetical protein
MSASHYPEDLILHQDAAGDWAAVYSDRNGELLHQGHIHDVYEWIVSAVGVRSLSVPLAGRSSYPVSLSVPPVGRRLYPYADRDRAVPVAEGETVAEAVRRWWVAQPDHRIVWDGKGWAWYSPEDGIKLVGGDASGPAPLAPTAMRRFREALESGR